MGDTLVAIIHDDLFGAKAMPRDPVDGVCLPQ
jgi:hypothetical protein